MLAAWLVCAAVLGATQDNDVEWNGVSHLAFQDRRPLCPIGGETFEVRFRAYRGDLTAARVRVDDGQERWVDARVVEQAGAYDIWAAQVPSTSAAVLRYVIELTDGTDTDYYSISGMSDGLPGDGGFVLDYGTLAHAPIGATLVRPGGAVFRVWAPTATSAYVRGEFNGWGTSNPMRRVGEHWVAYVPAARDRQQYKYFFQPGNRWNTDPRARSLNAADNYNARIEDPFRYQWRSRGFVAPAIEDAIVYELHVGTFSGRNDPVGSGAIPGRYRDVAAHADHLAELGVNVVELTPVTEYPWDFSAGYNPVTMWSPEGAHGTPDDLKALVDALHERGIAVIHDIVWNHFSGSDNFLWQFDGGQIYFDTPAVETPWGSQADFDRAEVRDYFVHSMHAWMDELRMSGFRMDATDFMNRPPQEASGWSLMQRYNDELDRHWAGSLSFAEQLPNDPWVTRPTSLGGAGFDAQWHDAFTDTLRQELQDAAFGDPEMWRIRDIINGSGEYLRNQQAMNYLELHDEAWPSTGGQRMVVTIDPTFPHDDRYARGRVTMAQALVMFAPGVPAILQGSEWLEDTGFGSGAPDGRDRIDWSKKDRYRGVFDCFRGMIGTRRTNGALRANAGHEVFHINESGNVLAFQRWDLDGNVVVVVVGFGNGSYGSYRIGLPQPGDWYEIFNSQSPAYGGEGPVNSGRIEASGGPYDGFAQSGTIAVPAMGVQVLRWREPLSCPADFNGDGAVDSDDFFDFLNAYYAGDGAADVNGDGTVDSDDFFDFLNLYYTGC